MGCHISRESHRSRKSGKSRQRQPETAVAQDITAPGDPPGMIPKRRRDEQGVPIVPADHDLSRQNILKALGYVAQYLEQKGKDIVLVAVGGAVNTVFLKTRASTHDVDFFNAPLSGSQTSLLREAIQYAEERSSVPLGERWMNNETGTIGGTVEHVSDLVQTARRQDDVIFHEHGLTVLCAPWHYAFIAKIGRMTYGTGRPYDIQDAVHYLHQYIRRHGGKPVLSKEIHAWGRIYKRPAPDEILTRVDALYYETYGSHGIRFT